VTADRWADVERLCRAALDVEPAARAAFLDEACAGDAELRREVESLLAQESHADAFLEVPAVQRAEAGGTAFARGQILNELRRGPAGTRQGLKPGTKLGPYEVIGLLGAGGMGEVYRARDTRLGRTVAVKILPDILAADPDRRRRFEHEARAASALNHPHICALFDVGESILPNPESRTPNPVSVSYLVMEHLEGETLAARIARGPVPADDVLEWGAQIADALAAAHRAGLVHRDLKPGNVMLTGNGAHRSRARDVKLLDFGLAKLRPAESGEPTPDRAGPAAESITAPGQIVGTLPYMAPEQLEGRDADARTDIWALGAILYEMVTGVRAFQAATSASLTAAILEHEPAPISSTRPMTPSALERLIRKCLAKDPDARWQSARDVADELRWLREPGALGAPAATVSTGGVRSWRLGIGGIAVLLAMAVGGTALTVTWLTRRTASRAAPAVTRSSISVDPAERVESMPQVVTGGHRTAIAIAPDGRRIAFVGRTGDTGRLYVRALAGYSASPYPGTESAECPVFSPDGNWIAFYAAGRLMKIPAAGGPVTQICATGLPVPPMGVSWGDDGKLVFAGPNGGLLQVPADGGTPASLTRLQPGEVSHRLPYVLPGSRWVLFTVRATTFLWGTEQVVAQSLSTGERKTLLERGAVDARFVPTGHLVYLRSGTLAARAFDLATMSVSGPEYGLVEHVAHALESTNTLYRSGAGQYAVSGRGTLIYLRGDMPASTQIELLVIDRRGRTTVLPTETFIFGHGLALSPDGRTAVVPTSGRDRFGLWLVDSENGRRTLRFSEGEFFWPVWTPDGRRIVFNWNVSGKRALAWLAADSTAPPELLVEGRHLLPLTWSPDGKVLLAATGGDEVSRIGTVSLDDPTRAFHLLLDTPQNQANAALSPDGRWLLFASDETGRPEIYLQRFPGPGVRHQVSTSGGMNPAWNPRGGELFWVAPGTGTDQAGKRWLMSASFTAQPGPSVGVARPLFEYPRSPWPYGRSYEVFPDGDRFLTARARRTSRAAPATEIALVDQWSEELRSKVPAGR